MDKAEHGQPASVSTTVTPAKSAELILGDAKLTIPEGGVDAAGELTLSTGQEPPEAAATSFAASTELIGVTLTDASLTGRATISRIVPEEWAASWRPVMVWQSSDDGWHWLPTHVHKDPGTGERVAVARAGHFSDGFLAAFDARAAAERNAKAFGDLITGRAGVASPHCEGEVNRPGFHAPSGLCEPAGWLATWAA